MNINLASLGIIGLLTPFFFWFFWWGHETNGKNALRFFFFSGEVTESCFSMTLPPLWIAGLEGTCTWSGVCCLHHHPINKAGPDPAYERHHSFEGYLGISRVLDPIGGNFRLAKYTLESWIVIFQTTTKVVSEIYNQLLLMQQESIYYQPKQHNIFQENLPQQFVYHTNFSIKFDIYPAPPKKKNIRLPLLMTNQRCQPWCHHLGHHQPVTAEDLSQVPQLAARHPSQGCASSWWPIHLHGGRPVARKRPADLSRVTWVSPSSYAAFQASGSHEKVIFSWLMIIIINPI